MWFQLVICNKYKEQWQNKSLRIKLKKKLEKLVQIKLTEAVYCYKLIIFYHYSEMSCFILSIQSIFQRAAVVTWPVMPLLDYMKSTEIQLLWILEARHVWRSNKPHWKCWDLIGKPVIVKIKCGTTWDTLTWERQRRFKSFGNWTNRWRNTENKNLLGVRIVQCDPC